MQQSLDRRHSAVMVFTSQESLVSVDSTKKKRKGGLFSRLAASVSSLASLGRRDAAAQTPSSPLAHKHTQTDDPPIQNDRTETALQDAEGSPVSCSYPLLPPALRVEMRTDSPAPKTVHFFDVSYPRGAPEGSTKLGNEPDPTEDGRSFGDGPSESGCCSNDPRTDPDLEGLEVLLRDLDILGSGVEKQRRESSPLVESGRLFRSECLLVVGGRRPVAPASLQGEVALHSKKVVGETELPSPPSFFREAAMSSGGECDFTPCLRPSDVRGGERLFYGENRSGNGGFEFHSPPVTATYSQSHTLNGNRPAKGGGGGGAAVLLEERVTEEEEEDGAVRVVVRERVFGLPLREMVREEVRTACFRPAPPKYEGIGPTDREGLPLAPRQMVEKEHDWYKTMFKTLHPTDASNDTQEEVRYGGGSSPEKKRITEKPELHSPHDNAAPPPATRTEVGHQFDPIAEMPLATALFPFRAIHENEISLSKGDIVPICRRIDANWFEGEHRGRRGLFPANHVQVPDSLCGRVLYDFPAQSPLELSVKKGEVVSVVRSVDANWWAVRRGEEGGIVPAAYIALLGGSHSPRPALRFPSEERPYTPPQVAAVGREERREGNTLIEPLMCLALFPYSPAHPDELELRAGDRVCVVERCEDGWCAGASARTGRLGLFPGNYVEPLHGHATLSPVLLL